MLTFVAWIFVIKTDLYLFYLFMDIWIACDSLY